MEIYKINLYMMKHNYNDTYYLHTYYHKSVTKKTNYQPMYDIL